MKTLSLKCSFLITIVVSSVMAFTVQAIEADGDLTRPYNWVLYESDSKTVIASGALNSWAHAFGEMRSAGKISYHTGR